VITASSVGTLFEWYDFYLYGSLAVFFGKKFFPAGNDTAQLLASLATFGAGFGVRPLDLYCGDDGRVFYVVAAPDETAIRQRHAADGATCPRIRRVHSLHSASDELGDDEKAVVRRMIVAEQSPAFGVFDAGDEWVRQVG